MVADLAIALAARDPATAAHSARVGFLAERLAVWLDWEEGSLDSLRLGAPLHDIGKLQVSQAILHKRGPLNERELAEVRTHPAAGAKLIAETRPTSETIAYVLYHHERWDGRGYPTGRSGRTIPQGARLLAVADAFDAMISSRPYRRALPVGRALAEVERCAGTQFDPEMATAFLDAWSAGALQYESAALG